MTTRGLPVSVWIGGAVAGVAVAGVYALSPLTVWCGAALAALFTLAGWRLPQAERRWVLGLLACALALRVIVVLGLFWFGNDDRGNVISFFFDGDGRALKVRSMWMRNAWLGIPLEPYQYDAFLTGYGWSSFLVLLAYLQLLLGPAPYGIHLLNIALFLTAAVIMHHLARRAYGPPAALIGLAFMLFSPGLFLWSVSAMKESFHIALNAILLLCAVLAIRASTWPRRAVAALGVAAALVSVESVRAGALNAGLLSLVLALLMTFTIRRPYVLILAVVAGGIVGLGVGRRAHVQDQVKQGVRWGAELHLGRTNKEGHNYRLLDRRFYESDLPLAHRVNSMTWAEAMRFAVRAPVSFVLVPWPFQVRSWPGILFVPAQFLWYGLFFLATVGLATALRRDTLVTSLLVSFALVIAAVISLTEGNIGTLVRHRDLVVPLFVWVSAIGAIKVLAWFATLAPTSLAMNVDSPVRG